MLKTMNKSAKVLGLVAVVLLVIYSCNKDEDSFPPTILLVQEDGYISSDTSLAAGSDIRMKIMISKGSLNITNFLIDVYTDSVSRYFDTGMNTEYLLWEGMFIKTLAPMEDWKFMAIDRDGNTTVTSINISLEPGSQYNPLRSYSPIDFGAQDNLQFGGCFNISDRSMYDHQTVAADTSLQKGIDMLCFYDPVDENTIASSGANIEDGIFPENPSDWTFTNETRYMKSSMSIDDFITAVNDSIILANYDEGEAKRKAKKLKVDDIYTFRTESGKLGMFLVNAVNGTGDGSINIRLKTQL